VQLMVEVGLSAWLVAGAARTHNVIKYPHFGSRTMKIGNFV
jgi:hypothetical protein